MTLCRILFIVSLFMSKSCCGDPIPLVINTWAFVEATQSAWNEILRGGNSIDALVAGGSKCEELQCDGTVGYGGSPDEKGETTQDAMIFDGSTMNMGAVAGLRRVKSAISVARHVLHNTKHSLLVGDLATQFAIDMGFKEESLSTEKSQSIWKNWLKNKCQPNFWINVEPDPAAFCGPYHPLSENSLSYQLSVLNYNNKNHDTIGMIVIDSENDIVAGTSSNGANHKIPGRVGDSPLPGAGAYADSLVGAAVATGDGDVMMRFLPSFLAVEEMRRGKTPQEAADIAIARIAKKYPTFFGAVVVVNVAGEYAAACNGMKEFVFSVANGDLDGVTLQKVKC